MLHESWGPTIKPHILPEYVDENFHPKSPEEFARKYGYDRHGMYWYPKRCELETCDEVNELSMCGGCGMVSYCW
jgi:hypothetical protein